jgi:hypothetical protein
MPAGSSFLITEGMLSDKIVEINFNGETFYSIGLRNQLLHAVHPLGWICSLDLVIDGKAVPKEDVFFEIRGQWICTAQMHTITDIFWYIMEDARLNVRKKTTLSPGSHDIECEFAASMLEVATQLDLKEKWPRRHQTVVRKAFL